MLPLEQTQNGPNNSWTKICCGRGWKSSQRVQAMIGANFCTELWHGSKSMCVLCQFPFICFKHIFVTFCARWVCRMHTVTAHCSLLTCIKLDVTFAHAAVTFREVKAEQFAAELRRMHRPQSEINPNASHWHWWSWLTRVTLTVGSSCCPPIPSAPHLPCLTQLMSKLDWRQRSQCGTGEKTPSYPFFLFLSSHHCVFF